MPNSNSNNNIRLLAYRHLNSRAASVDGRARMRARQSAHPRMNIAMHQHPSDMVAILRLPRLPRHRAKITTQVAFPIIIITITIVPEEAHIKASIRTVVRIGATDVRAQTTPQLRHQAPAAIPGTVSPSRRRTRDRTRPEALRL